MKRMKIALMAMFAIFMGTTFTSCLNSDSESSWDLRGYSTWEEGMFSSNTFKMDVGYTITVTNGDAVFGSGKYPERSFLYFKLAEGEVLTEGKTSYTASVVDGFRIEVKNFCNDLDTLNIDNEVNPHFSKIEEPWVAGNYLNLSFNAAISEKTYMQYFNLFPTRAEGNTLYATLHHDEEDVKNTYQNEDLFMNFRLPNSPNLRDMLGTDEYNKLEFFGSTRDSINLVIEALGAGSGNSKISSKAVKVKIIGAYY